MVSIALEKISKWIWTEIKGIGGPFNIITGIDQEESICPLLWVIYYDPMFEAINSPHQGISYTASLPTYIPSADSIDIYQLKLEYKLQGYLDDTTWITDNIP